MSLVDRSSQELEILDEQIENTETPEKEKMWFFAKIKIIFVSIVVITVVFSLLSGLYMSSHTLNIDNPTGTWITVQIDEMDSILIPSLSTTQINLKSWTYTLKVNGEEKGKFTKDTLDFNAFLNPSEEFYVQEYILYWEQKYLDKLQIHEISMYNDTIEGPFKTYSWIYIKGDWDYGIDRNFPNEVKTKGSYKIKSKLYRYSDFIDMFNQDYVEQQIVE